MKDNLKLGFIIITGVFCVLFIWLKLIDIAFTDDKDIFIGAVGLIGAISGLLTLFGVRITLTSQYKKEANKIVEENKTFLSASKINFNFTNEEKFGRKENKRILLTKSYHALYGSIRDTAYYSFTRYGGAEIITNCHFKITVGKNSSFNEFDVIEAWVDYFEKDEEILIPICSRKLNMYNPCVKEIRATFYTINNDKIEFIQSELENSRNHIFYNGEEQQSIGFTTNYTSWTQKQY